jgi:glutamate racemase
LKKVIGIRLPFLFLTVDMNKRCPIGVFDSGYGGLTILNDLRKVLPKYDFLYLGDNARAPYGPRSFDVVYEFTLQAVKFLFNQGCEIVILACNTASAKALRSIQQKDLPKIDANKRVLGVIRPTSEIIGTFSKNKHIGILATEGTIKSDSYRLEIAKFFPEIVLSQKACPIWVPLIENQLYEEEGGKWFIKRDIDRLLAKDAQIDTLLLGCTHYPLVASIVRESVSDSITVVTQGEIVANSLKTYLERHSDLASKCSQNGMVHYLTTETASDFDKKASAFVGEEIHSTHVVLK